MRARKTTPALQVWQYNDQAVIQIPIWVAGCTEMHGDGLYTVRWSGKQLIKPGEWLVQEPGGDVLWLTDAEFQTEYELIPN